MDLSVKRPAAKTKQKRKTEGRKLSSPNTAVPLPPCRVCTGNSTGYHFGVITCEACKAFFRRALVHKHAYKCLRDEQCPIVDKKLGNCSSCRLKKCYEVGMSKGAVRKGRYSIAVRTQAIVEANVSKGKDVAIVGSSGNHQESGESSSSSSDMVPKSGERLLTFSALTEECVTITVQSDVVPSCGFKRNIELELLIDAITGCQEAVYPELKSLHEYSLIDMQHKTFADYEAKQSAFESLFGKPDTVSAEEFKQVFAETGIDLDDRLSMFNVKGKRMEAAIAQYVHFGKVVPGFKNLNPKDVARLLKAAHLEFWLLGNFMLFNDDLGVAVNLDGSHGVSKEAIKKFFSNEWTNKTFEMAVSIKNLNLSIEEIALIRVIILTAADRCEISDREHIHSMQEKFMECLVYQLNKTRTNPSQGLYRIFNILISLREYSEMNFKENQKFLQKWGFIIQEFPLWKEMLSYDEV